MDLPQGLTKDERALAAAMEFMERARTLAATEDDIIRKAEIDAWFRQYGAVIRALREKIDPW